MCRMVADPKLSSDHLRHSHAGPYLAPEAVGWGTSLQKLRQLGALLFTQARPRAPGGGWRLKPSTPSCSARFIHWLTAPLLTPNARAMSSRCLQPSCLSSHARRRRPSRQSVAFWLDGVFSIWLMIPEFSCFRRDQYFDVVPPLRYTGSAAVRRNFLRWFDGFKSSIGQEICALNILASGDIAVAYMLIRASGTLKDEREVGYWVRATVCCQRSDHRWLITQEHISLPVDFESGIAAMDLLP
jgi:ketosteroid isomerase-like protein